MAMNMSIQYLCRQCGARAAGGIRAQPAAEIAPLAGHLGITLRPEFIARFTTLAARPPGIDFNRQSDGAVFSGKSLCRVHAVKPLQCRDFPARWNFNGFEKLCQARQLKRRTSWGLPAGARENKFNVGIMANHVTEPSHRLPPWIRVRLPAAERHYRVVHDALRAAGLQTVCESARCESPGMFQPRARHGHDPWRYLHPPLPVLRGKTRRARPPAADEPARSAQQLAVRVGTALRGGDQRYPRHSAGQRRCNFSANRRALHAIPMRVEVLTPVPGPGIFHSAADAGSGGGSVRLTHGNGPASAMVIRPQADYDRSLQVLRSAPWLKPRTLVKSGLMLGLGENDAELQQALRDLLDNGCRALTPQASTTARFRRHSR